jgi:adenylylsulfate reductase subunit B
MPPIIDKSRCKGCGVCVEICVGDVFYGSKRGKVPVIAYPEECWHCSACVLDCPVEGAIKLRVPLPMMISYK